MKLELLFCQKAPSFKAFPETVLKRKSQPPLSYSIRHRGNIGDIWKLAVEELNLPTSVAQS